MSRAAWPRKEESDESTVRQVDWTAFAASTKVRKAFVDQSAAKTEPDEQRDSNPVSLPPPEPEPAPKFDPQPEIDRLAALSSQVENQLAVLASAIGEVAKSAEQGYFNYRDEVLDLGLAVAGELAGGAIEVDPERVLTIIDEAFGLLGRDRQFRVYLNPNLYENMEIAGVLDEVKSNEQISVYSEKNVGELGLIIESDRGRVDGRIQARLNRLRHALKDEEVDSA